MYNQNGLLLEFPGSVAATMPRDVFGISDDFTYAVSGNQWTTVLENTSAISCLNTTGGWLRLTASNGDDEGILVYGGVGETFKLTSGKPIVFGARVTVTEANTDDVDLAIGFANNIVINGGANTAILGDSGGALPADYDGILFHKSESTSVWNFETSVGTTQVTDSSVHACTTGVTYLLEFEYDGVTTVSARIDGDAVASQTLTAAMIAAASECCLLIALKSDSATAEVFDTDYIYCYQLR